MNKLKLYVKEGKEVLEVIDKSNDILIDRYVNELGCFLSDFVATEILDADYNISEVFMMYRNNDDLRTEKLLEVKKRLPLMHTFFLVYSNMLDEIIEEDMTSYEGNRAVRKIAHVLFDIRALKKILEVLLEECFNVNSPNASFVSERYNKIIGNNNKKEIYQFSSKINQIQYDFWPEREYKYEGFKNKKSEYCAMIYPTTVQEIIYFLLSQMFINKTKLKCCKNCDRFYVVTRKKNSEYCNRYIDDTDKTCKDIGSVKKYLEQRKNDPIKREYTKAYNTKHARIRYGMITKDDFRKWAELARVERKKCEIGLISLEDFKYWLNRRIENLEEFDAE